MCLVLLFVTIVSMHGPPVSNIIESRNVSPSLRSYSLNCIKICNCVSCRNNVCNDNTKGRFHEGGSMLNGGIPLVESSPGIRGIKLCKCIKCMVAPADSNCKGSLSNCINDSWVQLDVLDDLFLCDNNW